MLFLYIAGKYFKSADYKSAPSGFLLVIEVMVGFIEAVLKDNFKTKTREHIPLFGTLMIIMLLCNLAGLLGIQVPTSNLSITLTLALIMIFLIHFKDIKKHGIISKIKNYFEPYPFLFPFSSQYFLLLTDIDHFFIHIFLRPQTKKKNAFTNKLLIGK